MNLRHPFPDQEWTTTVRSVSPANRTSVVRVTSYEERSSEPLEISPPTRASFTSHIEINGIRPRPFSPAIKAMMSEPLFSRSFPRITTGGPQNIKLSITSRKRRPTDSSSGYGSGTSVASSASEESQQPLQEEEATNSMSSAAAESIKPNGIVKIIPTTLVSEEKEIIDCEKKANLRDSFVRALDELEARIAFLRETANELEDEKQKLLHALHAIGKNSQLNQIEQIDQEEVITNTNRLLVTLETVTVKVVTRRTADQVAAIKILTDLLDFLEKNLHSPDACDREEASRMAYIFLNTCSSENDSKMGIDDKFQKQVIDCAGDDQKKVRKRLENIVRGLQQSSS